MEIISHINKLNKIKSPRVITIGNFDGVHIGHQKLIEKTINDAKEMSLPSLVMSFYPHPRKVFARNAIKLINTMEQKTELLSKLGIDFFS